MKITQLREIASKINNKVIITKSHEICGGVVYDVKLDSNVLQTITLKNNKGITHIVFDEFIEALEASTKEEKTENISHETQQEEKEEADKMNTTTWAKMDLMDCLTEELKEYIKDYNFNINDESDDMEDIKYDMIHDLADATLSNYGLIKLLNAYVFNGELVFSDMLLQELYTALYEENYDEILQDNKDDYNDDADDGDIVHEAIDNMMIYTHDQIRYINELCYKNREIELIINEELYELLRNDIYNIIEETEEAIKWTH